MTVCSVGVELFHSDGQTDITKIIVAFRYFASASKNRPKMETFVAKDQRHFLIDLVVSQNRKNIC